MSEQPETVTVDTIALAAMLDAARALVDRLDAMEKSGVLSLPAADASWGWRERVRRALRAYGDAMARMPGTIQFSGVEDAMLAARKAMEPPAPQPPEEGAPPKRARNPRGAR